MGLACVWVARAAGVAPPTEQFIARARILFTLGKPAQVVKGAFAQDIRPVICSPDKVLCAGAGKRVRVTHITWIQPTLVIVAIIDIRTKIAFGVVV